MLVLLYVAGVVWVWRREKAPPLIGEMAELDEKARATDEPHRRGDRAGAAAGARRRASGWSSAARWRSAARRGWSASLGIGESVIGLTCWRWRPAPRWSPWSGRPGGADSPSWWWPARRGGRLQRDRVARAGRAGQPAGARPAQRDRDGRGRDRRAPAGAAHLGALGPAARGRWACCWSRPTSPRSAFCWPVSLRGSASAQPNPRPGGPHAAGPRRRREGEGRAGLDRDRQRPRPRSRRGGRRSRRRAASATPTCTTARAASTTSSRSCSATRPPGSWSPSARASPRSRPATSWCSTGARSAATAGPAPAASRGTASPPTTRPRR